VQLRSLFLFVNVYEWFQSCRLNKLLIIKDIYIPRDWTRASVVLQVLWAEQVRYFERLKMHHAREGDISLQVFDIFVVNSVSLRSMVHAGANELLCCAVLRFTPPTILSRFQDVKQSNMSNTI